MRQPEPPARSGRCRIAARQLAAQRPRITRQEAPHASTTAQPQHLGQVDHPHPASRRPPWTQAHPRHPHPGHRVPPLHQPARDAVGVAFREARRDDHRHWGPGHLLLGLTAQDQGTAARALQRLGISQEQVRQQARQITTRNRQQARPAPQPDPSGGLIQAVLAEAAAHCDYHIGTSHLLLALFRADDQTAAHALARLGAGESQVRSAITALQAESGPKCSA